MTSVLKYLQKTAANRGAVSCRHCGSPNLRRSHRRTLWEHGVVLLLPWRPYRCADCRERVWGVDWPIITRKRLMAQIVVLVALVVFVLPTATRLARKVWHEIRPNEMLVEEPAPGAAERLIDESSVVAAGLVGFEAIEDEVSPPQTSTAPGPFPFLFVDPAAEESALTIDLRTSDPVEVFDFRGSREEERVVVKIPGDWGTVSGFALDLDHELAQRVELGNYPDGVRVTVELRDAEVNTTVTTHEVGLRIRLETESATRISQLGLPSG